jgi:succinoglycan biosynthesis transport protein ExoP
VSKNFELMRRAGNSFGSKQPLHLDIQTESSPSPFTLNSAPAPVAEKSIDWLRAMAILQKHWRLSAIFGLAVFLTVICVTYLTKPVYEATARIQIDPSGEVFSLDGTATSSDAEYMETEAQVLQSDGVALDVIRKLHLDQNPELVSGSDPADSTATTLASGGSGLQLTFREKAALHKFNGLLTVRRDTASRLVQVSFASHNPQLSAQVANTLVQTFIENTFQSRHDAIMKSSEWLSRQLDDIRGKMETSSRALAEYQGSIGVADVDGDKSTYTEHMGELSRQYTQAESERIQLEALLKNVHGNPDSLPEVRNNPVVQQLSQKLAEQRAELSQALVVYGSNHPVAKKLQSQVDELQSQLNGQKHAIVNSIRASYAAAEARERLMSAEMKGTTKELGQMARYTALKKEVQTDVDLYNSLYAKIKEAGIAAASKSANIHVMDPALVPDTPSKPRWLLNICVGLLGAIFGAVMLAFISEELDNKLRSPEDIKQWIGTSNVSIIPVVGEAERQEARLTWPKRMVGLLPSSTADDTQTNAFFLERPNSPEGEAVQALYASIMLSRYGHPPQALLITSGFPGEGKTTVALNLAYALAKQGRTCLVDADLRKGRLARAVSLNSKHGLGELLLGEATLDSALLEIPGMSNLSIIPAGTLKGNAGELICSETMQQVLEELRQRFQFVVVDSAPILPFVDGRAISTLVDAVILVGRSGITTRQAMQRSVELLSEVRGAPILQVVLNAADQNSTDYKHYGYGYSYTNTTESR